MRYPNIYSATELRHWHVEEEYEPGKWRPARPCECRSGGWLRRINLAWSVFTGRRDAIHWGNRSGEWKNDQQNYRDCTHPDFGKANKRSKPAPFREYTLTLREIKPGEFTIVSFSHIEAFRGRSTVAASALLRTKEILVRRIGESVP